MEADSSARGNTPAILAEEGAKAHRDVVSGGQ